MPTDKAAAATLPEGYAELLTAAKDRVRQAHITAARRVNSELVLMYLDLGRLILDRQADEGWGAGVIHHLAKDLEVAFPGQRGLSERNLRYCRTAARMFPAPIGPQLVAQLPWGHARERLDVVCGGEFLADHDELRLWYAAQARLWYAAQAVEHGWSRNVLEHHIGAQLHTRVDRSPTPPQIPVAVTYQALPETLRGQLPSPEALTHVISNRHRSSAITAPAAR